MNEQHNFRVTRRQLAGSIFWGIVSIVFGWTLFALWWVEVLEQDQPRPLFMMILIVAIFAVVVLVGTFVWIAHNRRIARHGSRGSASRFSVPRYERDAVGREIDIPRQHALRAANVVTIAATSKRKRYSLAAPEQQVHSVGSAEQERHSTSSDPKADAP
ncbi:MAG: hypothetical protein KFH98_02855 [Gemmatimonadetes bacterium]|nr:hypothetical protein [Gemmatimonadota bacterium]